MSRSLTVLTAAAASAAAVVLPLLAASPASAAPTTGRTAAASAVRPGLVGSPITLDNKAEFSGYDVAVDAAGRAYIGWISDKGSEGRQVHFCTLLPGARQCKGGIQTVDTLGSSTAFGLTVLATPGGVVTLVWQHATVASENGPQGDEIATATSQRGGPLSAPQDMATAPSFGSMLDATFGPNNSIWVLSERSVAGGVQVRPGLTRPAVNLHTPYGVGGARLRFSHGTGVLVIQKAGAISANVAFAVVRNGGFSGFSKVGKTWTSDANLGLTATTSGIRMVTSVDNASYHPVAWSFGGGHFGRPTLTGDLNDCSPSSHDLVGDASGRAADASIECSDLAITNLTDTRHAAVTRVSVHNETFAGGTPQLATTPRGTGWVAWSVESSVANKLFVAPFVLPGRVVSAAAASRGGKVTVRGPASCLPPVDVRVGLVARTARNWHVTSHTLRLGGTVLHSTTLHGSGLAPGKTYTLSGTVTFAHGGSRATATAKIKFRSCPK